MLVEPFSILTPRIFEEMNVMSVYLKLQMCDVVTSILIHRRNCKKNVV